MPANQFVPQSAIVRLYYTNDAQLAVNTIGCIVTGAPAFDQAYANTVGAAIKTAFTTNWAAMCTPAISLVRVGVRDYRTANQPEFRDTGAAVPGTGAGDPLPGQIAFAITLRTAKSGKSFRGRVFLPGVGEAQNVSNGLAANAVGTQGVAFVQAIDTVLAANGMRLAVLSKPAEASTLVRTTFHNDGTSTAETLSRTTAKGGQVNQVTIVESRDLFFETQRKRSNRRGSPPTLSAAASVDLAP